MQMKNINSILKKIHVRYGNNLFESDLVKQAFKGGCSLLHPMTGNKELLEYIDIVFDK